MVLKLRLSIIINQDLTKRQISQPQLPRVGLGMRFLANSPYPIYMQVVQGQTYTRSSWGAIKEAFAVET